MYKFSYFLLTFILFIKPGTDAALHSDERNNVSKVMQEERFSLLSYNLWGLPISLEGHDQERRFDLIPDKIVELSADIVCLQECFDKNLRVKLKQGLFPHYNSMARFGCWRRAMGVLNMDCQGGLMTLSKFPIIEEQFIPFIHHKGTNMIEKIGAKGLLVTVIDLGRDTINVINTHMYSGNTEHSEEHRILQAQQIGEILDTMLLRLPYATMLAGDFNMAHPDIHNYNEEIVPSPSYHILVDDLCFEDSTPSIDESDFTMSHEYNPYSSDHDGGHQKLDYCMMSCASGTPLSFVKSDVVLTEDSALSDHMGLLSQIAVHREERFDATYAFD